MEERVKKLAKLLCEWSLSKWEGKENSLLAQISYLFKNEYPAEWKAEWEKHGREGEE